MNRRPREKPRFGQRAIIPVGCLLLLLMAALPPKGSDTAIPQIGPQADPAREAPEQVVIATGQPGGTAFAVGGTLCAAVNEGKASGNLRCGVVASSGSIENLDMLRSGEVDLAIIRSDWLHHAYHGTDLFAVDGPADDLRQLMTLYPMPLTIMVQEGGRRSRSIEELADLPGQRINIGPVGSSERAGIEILMAELGWDQADFALVGGFGLADQGDALCNDEIDALLMMTAHPSGLVAEIAAQCDVRFIAGRSETAAGLQPGHPYYSPAAIPAPIYPDSAATQPVPSIGVTAVLVGRSDLAADIVGNLLRTLRTGTDRLAQSHPALTGLDQSAFTARGGSAPLHQATEISPGEISSGLERTTEN